VHLQHGTDLLETRDNRSGLLRRRGSQEILAAQTAEALQPTAPLTVERLGGQRRRLIAPVGFVKEGEANGSTEQRVGRGQQPLLGADATQDEMGVGGIGRQEPPGGLDGGVRRLDGDLRRRQVAADQDVQVPDLRESVAHGVLLLLHHYAGPP